MPKSFGGFGTRYCGERDYRKDGSYMTTTFFCVLFFPVFPLHSVRVIPDPRNNEWEEMHDCYYLVSEKRAPNLPQVASVYLFEAMVVALMFLDIVKIEPVLKRLVRKTDCTEVSCVGRECPERLNFPRSG